MKKSIYLLIFFLFNAFHSQSQPNELKHFIEQELRLFPDCEVAIGIIDQDEQYTLGYRIVNGKPVFVNNRNTLFEIASISKVFVAALLAKEIDKKTISLDDPLQKHLSFDIKQDSFMNHTLKIKHVATHSSGLKKNPLTNYSRYSNYLKKFELNYIPGTTWEYNNLTVGLISAIVSEKYQSTWSNLLKESLLIPLKMNSTYVHLGEVPEENRVQCLNKKGEEKECYFHKIGSFQWPSGGIISNVDDMLKWLKANMKKESNNFRFLHTAHQVLEEPLSIPWFTKYNATQGILWQHYKTTKGENVICHGGNSPQQTSFLAFDKIKQRGMIILSNIDGRSLMNEAQIMKTTDLTMKVLER